VAPPAADGRRPFVSVALLSLIGVAVVADCARRRSVAGGLGGAAFHPAAAALVHRLGGRRRGLSMSIHITGAVDWVFARAGAVRTVCRYVRTLLDTASGASRSRDPRAILAGTPAVSPFGAGPSGGFSDLRPYAKPLTLLYLIVVLRTNGRR